MLRLCVSLDLFHFVSFLPIYVVKRNVVFPVTHTFNYNGPKLADWSKWICITLQSWFCRLLTSNWKVSAGRSENSFINFAQITQRLVISSYIGDIEVNL